MTLFIWKFIEFEHYAVFFFFLGQIFVSGWLWKENKDASIVASSEKMQVSLKFYIWFSLFKVVMFYIVTISKYWMIASGANTGLGSCEPLITFSSTNQYMIGFYVLFLFKYILFNIHCWLINIEFTANSTVTLGWMKLM